jgi:integrase
LISERLKALQVPKLNTGRHVDGKGLCLVVKPSGARSWVLRVQVDGRRRDIGLGSVDTLSLAEARAKAAQGRRWAKEGKDPSFEWRKAKETIPTFEKAARACFADLKSGWSNSKHAAQWLSTLEQYAFPLIGSHRVDRIDSNEVLSVLLPIWLKVPETATRVRQRVRAVLDYSKAKGWRKDEAPSSSLSKALPRQSRHRGHHKAMAYPEIPALWATLNEGGGGTGRLALMLTILTAARSGETRGATWAEFDLSKALWTIPGKRMKGGVTHVVPLSQPALAILKEMSGLITGKKDEPVFPGNKGKPLSDATMAKALRVAGGGDNTVHGMRSTFRDWVAEKLPSVPNAVAETALAHKNPNEVEAAYRRTMFLDQRRDLMTKWADYLSGQSNVVRLVNNG